MLAVHPYDDFTESKLESNEPIEEKPYVNIEVDVCFYCYSVWYFKLYYCSRLGLTVRALIAQYMLSSRVCLSVCLSQVGVLLKQLNVTTTTTTV